MKEYGKWLLSSLGCYSDDNGVPLLQLYVYISSIYFVNYVETFLAESLDSSRNHLQQQEVISVMLKS